MEPSELVLDNGVKTFKRVFDKPVPISKESKDFMNDVVEKVQEEIAAEINKNIAKRLLNNIQEEIAEKWFTPQRVRNHKGNEIFPKFVYAPYILTGGPTLGNFNKASSTYMAPPVGNLFYLDFNINDNEEQHSI